MAVIYRQFVSTLQAQHGFRRLRSPCMGAVNSWHISIFCGVWLRSAVGLYLHYRHKQQCMGSYRRVQELSPGGLEPKRSKAAEVLNEDKAEEPVCRSWQSTHTSNKSRRSNINEKEDGSSVHVTDDAIGCSKMDSSRDGSNKKIKLLKDVSSDLQRAETVQEAPKRPRMAALENQDRSRRKKRKHSKRDGSYSVIIEWLNYYCLSESDEDEVPLINKRTERRRRQKLHEMSLGREPSNCVEFGGSTSPASGSCPLDPGDNSKLEIVPASLHEERSWPNRPAGSNVVAGNQTGHESMPSPLNSPVRGEIVDISDG